MALALSAHAVGTEAGTEVPNTFVLGYQVGGVDQSPITNDPAYTDPTKPAPVIDPAGPTVITVDRVVDITGQCLNSPLDVAPSSVDNALFVEFENTGNDNVALDLDVLNTAAGDFEALNITFVGYYLDNDGSGTIVPGTDALQTYTPNPTGIAASLDIPPDEKVLIVLEADVPDAANVDDGFEANFTVLANALNPASSLDANYGASGLAPGTESVTDSDGNTITGFAETVLNDLVNISAVEQEGAEATPGVAAGNWASECFFSVAEPDLAASKEGGVVQTFPTDCATDPIGTDQYSVPQACIFFDIDASNSGSVSATNIAIGDTLDSNLIFVSATHDFGGAPSLNTPASGTDCGTTTCLIELTGAELAAGASATLTIRALVK